MFNRLQEQLEATQAAVEKATATAAQTRKLPKRWYKQAIAIADASGWQVQLDGKVLRSPAANALLLPNQQVAEMVAAEWHAVPHNAPIDTRLFPAFSLCCIASDVLPVHAETVREELLGYLDTELLCYRAGEPDALVLRQAEQWNPVLDWATARYGVALPVVAGVMPVAIRPEDRETIRQELAAKEGLTLAVLATLVKSLGSLLLGLAVLEQQLQPEAAVRLSLLDAHFQQERWGREAEHEQAERRLEQEAQCACRLLEALA